MNGQSAQALFPVSAAVLSVLIFTAGPAVAQSAQPALFITTYPNAAQGYVTSMTINPDGTLDYINAYATSDTGPQSIAISPDGRYVAVSHGTADNVSEKLDIFSVNSDETLTHLLVTEVPDSPLDLMWITSTRLAVTQTSLSQVNTVGIYELDPGAPVLTEIARADTGDFNSNVLLHPHTRFLFANDSFQNVIRPFEIDPMTGALAPVGVFPSGGLYPLGMGATHNGRYLYAGGGISGSGHAIIGYDIDPLDGSLALMSGSPFSSPGQSPKATVASPDDKFLFVAHGTDATIQVFAIDPDDGSLTFTGHSFDVGFQGTLGEIVVMRDKLFVTDNSTVIDGVSGVYSFTIESDGSLVMNGGGIYSTHTDTPNTMAVWDPQRGMDLEISDIVSGREAQFRVTGAAPDQDFGLVYSSMGPGFTHVNNNWLVDIDLMRPMRAGPTIHADAQGSATWALRVPNNPFDIIWFQAVRPNRVSNVVSRRVE